MSHKLINHLGALKHERKHYRQKMSPPLHEELLYLWSRVTLSQSFDMQIQMRVVDHYCDARSRNRIFCPIPKGLRHIKTSACWQHTTLLSSRSKIWHRLGLLLSLKSVENFVQQFPLKTISTSFWQLNQNRWSACAVLMFYFLFLFS